MENYEYVTLRSPFDDAADGVALFADAVEQRLDLLEFLRWHHQHHADAHIEGAHHLLLRMLPSFCRWLKIGSTGQLAHLDHRGSAFGQNARQIFRDAAAGDVRHRAARNPASSKRRTTGQ